MTTKRKSTKSKKVPAIGQTLLLVMGKVYENGVKVEKTKRGFPTQLPVVKVLAGRKKIEIYKGLNTDTFKVNQNVELKCSIMKVKSGNRTSTKYILVS